MDATVLIVDDHAGFRTHARQFLESVGYRVVGEAEGSTAGLEAARTLKPELALVDVYMPDGDGFELASRIASLPDAPAVILISSHDASELSDCIAQSPARGFVSKAELSRSAIEQLMG
jgi:DNA-binding NarL/FixJ family response regulator